MQIPAVMNQYLRDYQRDGVSFMYNHVILEQGCILGDDMGLGKTVQVFIIDYIGVSLQNFMALIMRLEENLLILESNM